MTRSHARCTNSSLLLAALMLAVPAAQAADGDLDPTFGDLNGIARIPAYIANTRYASQSLSLAVQSDGNIVISGNYAGYASGFVERVLADGSARDPGFYYGQGITVLPGYPFVTAPRVKLDANQRIVVGGNCPDGGQDGHPCLWRLLPDGTGDTTFGDGGWVELPAVQLQTYYFYPKVVDFDFAGDGSIYVLVGAEFNQYPYLTPTPGLLFKLDTSGNVVGGSNGAALGAPSGFDKGNVRRIAISGNKITIASSLANSDTGNLDCVIERFNLDGSGDSGFGSGGVASFSFNLGGAEVDDVAAMLIQPDGKILIGATAQSVTQLRMGVARLRADGSGLDSGDPGFAYYGQFTFTSYYDSNSGDRSQDTLTDLALQGDGKIVAVGWSDRSKVSGADPNADNINSVVTRFDAIGQPDPDYTGTTRNLALGFMSDSARVDHIAAVGLQGNRVVVAGDAGAGGGASDIDIVVARLQTDRVFADSFDGDSISPY